MFPFPGSDSLVQLVPAEPATARAVFARVTRGRSEDAEGFTFVEVMVVVLVIGVLISLAIPAFLGTKDRANDRAAEGNLRTAYANAKALFVDDESYAPVDAAALAAVEPSLGFTSGPSLRANQISVWSDADSAMLAAWSPTGRCLVMADLPKTIGVAYRDLGRVSCDAGSALPLPGAVPTELHTSAGGPWALAW